MPPGRDRPKRRTASKRRAAGAALTALHREILACTRCRLWQTRTQAVPGEGPPDAAVMFIGEAPGRTEDRKGRPLVGAAGRLFDELLAGAALRRADVFITNVLKSRPTESQTGPNRAPRKDEQAACAPWLVRQLEILRPRLIVTMGNYALGHFVPHPKITRMRGRLLRRNGWTILPTLHPASVLHGGRLRGSGSPIDVLRADFRRIPALLKRLRPTAARRRTAGARNS